MYEAAALRFIRRCQDVGYLVLEVVLTMACYVALEYEAADNQSSSEFYQTVSGNPQFTDS